MDSKVLNVALEGSFGDKFPMYRRQYIKERFQEIDELKVMEFLSMTKFYNPNVIFTVSFFFGYFGADRFLLGQTGLGILKLITLGGFGIWALVDWFSIKDLTRKYNYEKIQMFLA